MADLPQQVREALGAHRGLGRGEQHPARLAQKQTRGAAAVADQALAGVEDAFLEVVNIKPPVFKWSYNHKTGGFPFSSHP
jgi:hypothetical protein